MTNRSELWRVGALQALTFAARGLIFPFTNLYLLSVGFNNAQIGTLISATALAQLVISPALNALADHHGRHRSLYYWLTGVTVIGTLAFTTPISPVWLDITLMTRTVADSAAVALLAQLTVTWLATQGRAIYGRLRSLGSLGYGLTTIVAGAIFAAGGYRLLFILSAVITGLTLLFVRALPVRTAEKPAAQAVKAPRGANFYWLAAAIFLYYIGSSAFNGFSSIYYQKELGADNGMIGLVTALSALAEIPAMLLIDRLIRRFNSRTMLIFGTAGLSGIFLALTLLHGSTLLIPLMVLRGTFFACQIVSLTLLVTEVSPPVIAATNQAIIQVTVPGVATLLTGLVSGWIFDQFGGRVLFTVIGVLGLASTGLLLLVRGRLTAYVDPTTVVPMSEPEVA